MDPALTDVPESFQTERLLGRAPRAGDGPELCAAITESLAELRPWMPWAQEPPTSDDSEANVRRATVEFLRRTDLRYQLYLMSDPATMVGSTGLHRIDWAARRFEIGYWIRTRFAGQGFATEAARGMATLAFRDLEANRVEIWCDARNEASAAIARRLGFRHEATFRNHTRATDGSLATGLCFALLREEAGATLGIDLVTEGR
ncbi:MAG: GNAT family N-acetyltransferase [Chloroflexi bacterium]|nr:GNAT family N-acetyltransferase [Chloroflexota bacterium]